MNLNNAYKVYRSLVDTYTPGKRYHKMGDAVDEAAHAFLQKGESMRSQKAEHPSYVKDISRMYNGKDGRKLRADAKGHVSGHGRSKERIINVQLNSLRKRKKTNSWRTHQSIACLDRGKCAYKGCPNLRLSTGKRKRSYDTYMKCEECSVIAKSSVYFYNNKKDGKIVNCHLCYHQKFAS